MKTKAYLVTILATGEKEYCKNKDAVHTWLVSKGVLAKNPNSGTELKENIDRVLSENKITSVWGLYETGGKEGITAEEIKPVVEVELNKLKGQFVTQKNFVDLAEANLKSVDLLFSSTSKKIDKHVLGAHDVIEKKMSEAIASIPPKVIELKIGDKKRKLEGLQHFQFEKVLKCFAAKTNVMMVGPAGSGKTTCADKAAEALGLNFYAISVGLQTSKVEFMGYMDANGKYVKTLFREAYQNGGVFLIDEIDAGNPGIMTIVNAALANNICAFPDQMVKKHDNFICAAAANTFGKGADRMYVGRNQLDAATLDRFVKMDFEYDEKLESKLATNQEWFELIKKIRKAVNNKKLRIIVSPRATMNGCAVLEQGMTFFDALELTIYNGISEDERVIIEGEAKYNVGELKTKKI